MNHFYYLGLAIKEPKQLHCHKTYLENKVFQELVSHLHLSLQGAGTMFGGDKIRGGQEPTYLIITQNKAYIMVLLLLFIFVLEHC